jgi:two-component SAPR family response regulator
MRQLEIRLLGRFEALVDSHPIPADAWPQRRAADLVKVLALAPGHRMPRDKVLETLWPQLGADAAASNLHKAASYARRALGERGAIVLRSGMVELAPDAEITTDVERFERGDDSAYEGELLPDDPYEHGRSRRGRACASDGSSSCASRAGGMKCYARSRRTRKPTGP